MPMDFPDMASLKQRAEAHGFRKPGSDEAEYCDYGISGDGRKLLRDSNYVPTILKELRKRTG